MKMKEAYCRSPLTAFQDAIATETLSEDEKFKAGPNADSSKHVSNWMYMYSKGSFDYFKNIVHRYYITSMIPEEEAGV